MPLTAIWFVPIGILAMVAWIWLGRRPTAERFASAQRLVIDEPTLPLVRAALRRTYIGRVAGALVGAVVLGALALLIGVGATVGAAFIGLVGGTMVGIALAQRRTRPRPGATRQAALSARTVASYAPTHAMPTVAAAAASVAAAAILVVISAPAGLGLYAPAVGLAASTLLIVPLGHWLQRRIVEAPRDAIEHDVDDALRTTAVRAVHHSVLGVLLCGLAVAAIGGTLTQNTLSVRAAGVTVFHAPPGSTSISADTGLRQAYGPQAPVRIFWIEADGSEHQTGWRRFAGSPTTGKIETTPLIVALWLVMLFAIIGTLMQWARATNAWQRGSPRSRVAATAPAGPST